MIKILIADDHAAIRKGVKMMLSAEFTDIEFEEASNANEAMQKLREKKMDILIMDMDMPGRNGLDSLKQIKDEGLDVKILMFSMHPEEQIAVRALRVGAHGYLSKDAPEGELVKAIRQLLAGKKYITPSLAEQLVAQMENPGNKAPHDLLSNREYETMLLIASGKTVSQIAEALSLSVPTISTYRARILEKMNMKTSAELTNYAIRNQLV